MTLQCFARMLLAVSKLRKLQYAYREEENMKYIRDQSARFIQRVFRGHRVRGTHSVEREGCGYVSTQQVPRAVRSSLRFVILTMIELTKLSNGVKNSKSRKVSVFGRWCSSLMFE